MALSLLGDYAVSHAPCDATLLVYGSDRHHHACTETHHSRIQDFPMWKINCSVRFLAARLRHQSTPPWGLMMWCGSVSSELSLNWSTSLNALEHFVLPTVLFPWTCFATVTVLMLFREEYLCNLYLLVSFSWNDNQISATLSQSQSRCSLTTT